MLRRAVAFFLLIAAASVAADRYGRATLYHDNNMVSNT